MDVSALFGRTPQQQTLAAPVEVTGRTLHSGEIARMTLHPANPGLGICFSRSDRTFADGLILARWTNLATGALCTQLENGRGVRVRLVEHVLAALAACAVDNAIIELDGDEPPVLDGSAALFVDAIQRAGIVRQAAPLSVIEVLEPVQVRDGERHATLRDFDLGATAQLTILQTSAGDPEDDHRDACDCHDNGADHDIERAHRPSVCHCHQSSPSS